MGFFSCETAAFWGLSQMPVLFCFVWKATKRHHFKGKRKAAPFLPAVGVHLAWCIAAPPAALTPSKRFPKAPQCCPGYKQRSTDEDFPMFLIDKNEGKSLLLCPAVATRGFLASASKENPGQQRWAQGFALLPAAPRTQRLQLGFFPLEQLLVGKP